MASVTLNVNSYPNRRVLEDQDIDLKVKVKNFSVDAGHTVTLQTEEYWL